MEYVEELSEQGLQSKKMFILNCIQLGMTFEKACIVAELHPSVIKQLENDKEFERELNVHEAELEMQLLEKYKEVIEKATERGNGRPLEYMLGHVNPERWSDKNNVVPVTGNLIISKEDEKLL